MTIEPLSDMMDALKVHVSQMPKLLALATKDNQSMFNTNGVGAGTVEQNSHDTGCELMQAASTGNALIVQPLLSALQRAC